MDFRRLLPEPGVLDVEELADGLALAGRAPEDRPYVVVNFVASADGRATFAGRSGELGDDGDRAFFHALRGQVDAVLAGTLTVGAERYGRMVSDPERRRRRADRGLAPEPLACLLTRRGDVPIDTPLFDAPEARIVVFTGVQIDLSGCRADVEVVRLGEDGLSFSAVLRRLRADFAVRSVLCEGGPTVFGALVRERVADELFLTLAPKLTGGGAGPAVSSGPELPEPARLRLLWVLEREGSLYLRYALG